MKVRSSVKSLKSKPGSIVVRRRVPESARPAVVGLALAAGLFFFVTLVLEPIWGVRVLSGY